MSTYINRYIFALALAASAASVASPSLAKTAPRLDRSTVVQTAPARDFEGSEYVGQDPDVAIQSELRRDPPSDR
jgi:hypothetical protein